MHQQNRLRSTEWLDSCQIFQPIDSNANGMKSTSAMMIRHFLFSSGFWLKSIKNAKPRIKPAKKPIASKAIEYDRNITSRRLENFCTRVLVTNNKKSVIWYEYGCLRYELQFRLAGQLLRPQTRATSGGWSRSRNHKSLKKEHTGLLVRVKQKQVCMPLKSNSREQCDPCGCDNGE